MQQSLRGQDRLGGETAAYFAGREVAAPMFAQRDSEYRDFNLDAVHPLALYMPFSPKKIAGKVLRIVAH